MLDNIGYVSLQKLTRRAYYYRNAHKNPTKMKLKRNKQHTLRNDKILIYNTRETCKLVPQY